MYTLVDGSNLLHRTMYDVDTKKLGIHPIRELYLRFMMADHRTWVVWDGYNANKRRRDIYPGYKGNRPEKGEDITAAFDILKEVLCFCPVIQLEIPTWEADDVLFTLAKRMKDECIVETNDTDFYQIWNEGVQLPLVKPLPCLPERTCLFKALVGDQADNIKGWRGFGPKRFEAVAHVSDEIERCLREEDYNGWLHINWPKGVIADYGTFFELCTYYRVVQMQIVPDDMFDGCVSVGTSNPAAAEQVLDKYRM